MENDWRTQGHGPCLCTATRDFGGVGNFVRDRPIRQLLKRCLDFQTKLQQRKHALLLDFPSSNGGALLFSHLLSVTVGSLLTATRTSRRILHAKCGRHHLRSGGVGSHSTKNARLQHVSIPCLRKKASLPWKSTLLVGV